MLVIKSSDFEKMLSKLPVTAQKTVAVQEYRFIENHRDSRLHTKKLCDLDGVFSIRITREYRALFYIMAKNTAVFFAIGNRKDIYKNL